MEPSIASSIWLVATVASLHADPAGMRQYNPGLGVEVGHWAAGEYVNSLDRKTWYGGYKWFINGDPSWRIGLLAGAATGYNPIHGLHVLPVPVPMLSYEGRQLGANLALLPNPLQWNESAIALQLKVRLR